MVEFYRKVTHLLGGFGALGSVVIFIGVTLVSTVAVVAVVIGLPADHFRDRPVPGRRALPRIALRVLRNLIGFTLLPLGVVMAFPLVPGPGVVVIVIALSLIDFPGKKALERRLLHRPQVRKFVDDLRRSFSRPPFELD